MTGPRFFGWADWRQQPGWRCCRLAYVDLGQNTANHLASPSASAAEEACRQVLLDLFDLPRESSIGFSTGATMAKVTGLAARGARSCAGRDGTSRPRACSGSPVTIVLGEEAHSTIFAGLKYLGFGERNIVRVAVDRNGAMVAGSFAEAMERVSGPVIAIAQTGHINSGAFDPFGEMARVVKAKGAWLHVDGAFGLWARATLTHRQSRRRAELGRISWPVDGPKWLQTPYELRLCHCEGCRCACAVDADTRELSSFVRR